MYYSQDLPYMEGVYRTTTSNHNTLANRLPAGLTKILKRYIGEKTHDNVDRSLWK
uniref:Transposase n=1 Tax=Haemonchus contortus TaxID=6289 RepID=A0A7I4XWH8_HAECO